MTDELVLSHSVGVAVSKEIDGVEMGVLLDGRSYFTARGLARICGVAGQFPSGSCGCGGVAYVKRRTDREMSRAAINPAGSA